MSERTAKALYDAGKRIYQLESEVAALRAQLAAVEAERAHERKAAELLPRLLKAARYYEREKPGWCPNDDEHDDTIEEAEALIADAERNGSGEPPTCQWREEDDDGIGIENTVCGKPAAYVSCVPYVKTYTCEQHKCRCAGLINGRGES